MQGKQNGLIQILEDHCQLQSRGLAVQTTVFNVCSAEKYTKRSSVLLLRLVYFSAEQTLIWNSKYRNRILCISRLYLIYKKPGHNPFFLISLVRSSKNEFLTFEYNLKLKMQKSNTIDIADLLLQKAFSHTFFLIH